MIFHLIDDNKIESRAFEIIVSSALYLWEIIKLPENPLHLSTSAYYHQGKDGHILMVHQ